MSTYCDLFLPRNKNFKNTFLYRMRRKKYNKQHLAIFKELFFVYAVSQFKICENSSVLSEHVAKLRI